MLNFLFPMILLYIIAIAFFFSNKKMSMSKFVVYCYVFIVFCSFLLLFQDEKYIGLRENFFVGSAFFSFLVFIHLLPFILVRDDKIEVIKILDYKLMTAISIITISFSFLSIVYFLSVIIKVFTSPDLAMFRHMLVTDGHPYLSPGIINTISGVAAILYCVPMLLGFLNMASNANSKIAVLLFISSLSYPFFVFAYFGRDGIIFWLMSIVSLYIMFKPFLDKSKQKKIKWFLMTFLLLGASVFIVITFARFGDLNNSIKSLLSYAGQQYLNFCIYFDLTITNTGGARTYTLYHDFVYDVGSTEKLKSLRWELASEGHEYMSWEWGTMFKDLYTDFGALQTALLVIIYSIYQYIMFNKLSKRPDIFMCLFFIIMCQLSWQGIFYFKNYSYAGNFYILLTFFIPLLSLLYKSKCNVLIEKNYNL